MKRLDLLFIVAALLLAVVTIAAVIVRAGGHDLELTSPAAHHSAAPAPQPAQASASVAS